MRFRLHTNKLHVHGCSEHPGGCDYFVDHTTAWMIGSREAAREQLHRYRDSVVARIAALNVILVAIDRALTRLSEIRLAS